MKGSIIISFLNKTKAKKQLNLMLQSCNAFVLDLANKMLSNTKTKELNLNTEENFWAFRTLVEFFPTYTHEMCANRGLSIAEARKAIARGEMILIDNGVGIYLCSSAKANSRRFI